MSDDESESRCRTVGYYSYKIKHILKNDSMTQKIQLQLLPLSLKNNININQLSFSTDNCAVSVFYTIYDKKKKIIVNIGSSKACGQNKDKSSIHAEELAIQYLRNMNNLNRYIIYIYRYNLCVFWTDPIMQLLIFIH